ncbi:acyl-CoA dehydrogenase NM domain-like protein [Ascodesmis nigricans]|uniref:Acyl-CoA dehydrogenase NM domain-like protein n=1 Tax=Ascodesmis nigricans TaxID=341454 RepID=A0A4S2MYQ2_9PEZI|nr:acyl-CoA dehydrogenase NM domain-like protein [Ascodesmis nigricans]
MDMSNFTDTQRDVREAISKACANFSDEYWASRDQTLEYPGELHAALAKDGWIGIALPEDLGGAGLGISEAAIMMQTITESGAGMAGAQSIHANIYATQPVAKFASAEQRPQFLTKLIKGEWRTCFGVTEPNTGLETLALTTKAVKTADGQFYDITGTKIWITNAQVASHMVLLARTAPGSKGLSIFFMLLDKSAPGLTLRKIPKMGAQSVDANEIFFDNYRIPASCLLGDEGDGFKIVLHGMNAERVLIGAEALGLGYAALRRAAKYAQERSVFGRPIGKNQSIQHELARSWLNLEAAKLSVYHAAKMYDEGQLERTAIGAMCNGAKYLAAEAAYQSCETAVMVHGGMGYAKEYHVERYFRECLVPRIAPISREMILNFVGEKVLGLPKSY